MNDSMDVDLQGILKKRSTDFDNVCFQNNNTKKSMKRVRIELPIGEDSDSEESSKLCSPKKRRGLNENGILISNINLKNQPQLLSQSNSNDVEYSKKNRIIVTPKSSLISQKLKNMKYSSLKHNNCNNSNNTNFIPGPLSPQSDNSPSKEINDTLSFSTSSPLRINYFNNNHKFNNTISSSLSPHMELNSSLNSPTQPVFTFSSSLPTSFTFHSTYKSNDNPFINYNNNNNKNSNSFSFNYIPNRSNQSNTILESDENINKSLNSITNQSESSLNQESTLNTSLSSSLNVTNESLNKINHTDSDDDDDTDAGKEKNSLLSKIARQSFETEKKRYMEHHKKN